MDMGEDRLLSNLVGYIFNHYLHLMTETEQKANSSLLLLEKARASSSEAMRQKALDLSGYQNPEIREFISMGIEDFRQHVCQRLLSSHRNDIFLNYCPECGNLTATPKAKLCLKCGHSWFDD